MQPTLGNGNCGHIRGVAAGEGGRMEGPLYMNIVLPRTHLHNISMLRFIIVIL